MTWSSANGAPSYQGKDDGFVPLLESEDNGNVAEFLLAGDLLGIGSRPAIQGPRPSGHPSSTATVKLLGTAILDENFHGGMLAVGPKQTLSLRQVSGRLSAGERRHRVQFASELPE